MAISQAVANVFKQNVLLGNHNFNSSGGNTYKIALYTSSATMGATTTQYATANQITNAAGSAYTAGGKALTNSGVTGGSGTTTAFTTFSNVSWTSASFTANGALIYQSTGPISGGNNAVVVLAFGGDFTATNGTFTIQFPTAGGGSEILRLG